MRNSHSQTNTSLTIRIEQSEKKMYKLEDDIDKHDRANYVVTNNLLFQDQTTGITSQSELTERKSLVEPEKQDAVEEVLFLHPTTAKTTQVSMQDCVSTSNWHRLHGWMRLTAR